MKSCAPVYDDNIVAGVRFPPPRTSVRLIGVSGQRSIRCLVGEESVFELRSSLNEPR